MPIATRTARHWNTGAPGYNRAVTHGEDLLVTDVGPWALQEVPQGDEVLAAMTGPGRGYWRFDAAAEFTSDTAWPSDANDSNPSVLNDPDLHEGKVTGSPVTIDGYVIPVGTYICQFREFPDLYDFYCQGTSLPILFRGCRFRFSQGLSGAGLFNDNTATSAQHILLHYCDLGLTTKDIPAGTSGLMHVKFLGGSDHRVHRCYHSNSATFFQPNTQGCVFTENLFESLIFYYGEAGPDGAFGSATYHLNGISSEGGISSITIARNRIDIASPDGSTGSTGTTAGQPGYGTQSGQTGYGSGTNPGRVTGQTDCIALFSTNGLGNLGTDGSILIDSNYLAGTGVCIYAGNSLGTATGVHLLDNKISTRYWTNGGQFGAITDVPTWGANGNVQSGNVWADDYGTGGDGSTALASRQYPAGNGPRAGTSFVA